MISEDKYLVFYGFAKLTKKIVRKRSVVVQYANSKIFSERQEKYINQKMHIVFQRYQTINEIEDAKFSDRSWTKYEYFVDDKIWNGNLDLVLNENFIAEENHVSIEERKIILEKLKKEYYDFYKLQKPLKKN